LATVSAKVRVRVPVAGPWGSSTTDQVPLVPAGGLKAQNGGPTPVKDWVLN
jgi:phage I-like protein